MNRTRLAAMAHPHHSGAHPSRPPMKSARRPDAARPRIPTGLLLLVMFVGGLCSLLALNTASAAAEVEARGVVSRNAEASDLQQQLQRDLALREAPDALVRAATGLGLVPNPNPAFLRVNADGSVTVLGQPVPASLPVVVPPPAPTKATSAPKPAATPTATNRARPNASATAGSAARKPTAKPTSVAPARTATPRPTSTGGNG